MFFAEFRNRIVEFGLINKLDGWDWTVAIISLFSLGIAVSSMVFAIKTLHSQEKTEKNTQPIMNRNIQLLLIKKSLVQLRDSFVFFLSLEYSLEKTNYKAYPSHHIWNHILIDVTDFHESLFYEEINKFKTFIFFKRKHESFCQSCIHFRSILENPKSDEKIIKSELEYLEKMYWCLMSAYKSMLMDCYDFDEKESISLLDELVIKNLNDNYLNTLKETDSTVEDKAANYPEYDRNKIEDFLLRRIMYLALCLYGSNVIPQKMAPKMPNGQSNIFIIPGFNDTIIMHVKSIILLVEHDDHRLLYEKCITKTSAGRSLLFPHYNLGYEDPQWFLYYMRSK